MNTPGRESMDREVRFEDEFDSPSAGQPVKYSPAYNRNGTRDSLLDDTTALINSRKQSWRLTPIKDSVGVGAYFETVHGGAIRVRGLAKGGPAEQSNMVNVGDELVQVDDIDVHGRPLSELGQYVLGSPGSTVNLTLRASPDQPTYQVYLIRGKPAVIPKQAAPANQPIGEVFNTLRL